jgi:5-methylcytosine-specific restriction protein A
MAQLDAVFLARRLEARYGLGLSGGEQEVDGGLFVAVRPTDLERPNGFSVIVARTPKIVEASLKMDGFTRSLLRLMSESDDVRRNTFATLAALATTDGFRIGVSVNENHITNLAEIPHGEWTKFEVDCDHRLPGVKMNPADLNSAALEVASVCLGLVLSLLPIEDVTDSVSGFEPGLPEGARIRVEVNRYERSPVNRAACIAHYGTKCVACGLEFSEKYGTLGSEYIEVHHRVPVSEMGGSYRLDPVKDLVTVCANCHAMLHRAKPPLSVEALAQIINGLRDGEIEHR